ncbi:hypothetical protein Spb1_06250 [Planctopirus ephydatiae]|uniref:Uncharacterized protein n=1 Tax=Planctopirus ephydatiae TaxID=2528019 RepID=A0A518GJL2_9PLAN|nr:hypothetical protein [Planctopirus ephydatiae]QDV28760.1 hypothetical protein Spb1_06250 [Planctopirus ephydatiae]
MLRTAFAALVMSASLVLGGQIEAADARMEVVNNRTARTGFFARLMELERRKNERIREWFRGSR